MKEFVKKIKIPLTVITSAIFIICFSALICAVFSGNTDSSYEINENVSAVTDANADLEDVFNIEVAQLYLPENYSSKVISVTERKSKRYTEKEVKTETGSIFIKLYNYAYLVEDDAIKIPDNAEKFTWQGTEVFIFENADSSCSAVYYKDLVRYTVNEYCSIEKMVSIFETEE